MKITKAIQNQLDSTKESQNIFIRGRVIWIDFQKNKERLRKSTKLKYSPVAFNFVKRNYERYLEKGAEIWLKKEFIDYENEITDKRLKRLETPKKETIKDFTFKKLFKDFLAEKEFLKINTKINIQYKINGFQAFLDKHKIEYVADFTRNNSIDLASYLLKNHTKTIHSYNTYFTLIRAIFNLAIKQEIISKNPIFIPKVSFLKEIEKKPFNLDEVKFILKNATGDLKVYLYIAFFTGMRTGEILALTWGDIDFTKNEINVSKTLNLKKQVLDTPKTKNSKRIIDMLDILAKELKKYRKADNENIITINYYYISVEFKALLKSLNLEPRRLYDTRHTFASIMLSKGEEPMWVGCKMLGHKDLNETYKSYAKYLPKEVKTRAKFLDDLNI